MIRERVPLWSLQFRKVRLYNLISLLKFLNYSFGIALYFAAYPNEAKKYYEDVVKYQKEEEQRQEELEYEVIYYVHKLKKSELEQLLLQVLFDGPVWQYERFMHEILNGKKIYNIGQ